MKEIWSRGEATVAEVHNALQRERGLAMTTIATVLSRLEKRGLVVHRSEKRQYIYRALVSETEVRGEMVQDLTDRLFAGDVAQLVSHLLNDEHVSPGDLERVRALIEEANQQKGE
jgi:predicted transcriptional regulator